VEGRQRLRFWALLGLLLLAGIDVAVRWLQPPNLDLAAEARSTYRNYTATAQIQQVEGMARGCKVTVKFHEWHSLSPGFKLHEIPQKGQNYTLYAQPEQCAALEVIQAEKGSRPELTGHIVYTAGENRSGRWYMLSEPRPPLGCGVVGL
jgi:hypothetical protein